MKKKIIGILICTLLIATVLPVAGSIDDRLNQKRNDAALGPDLVYSPTSHDFGYVVTGQTYETTFDIWNGGSGTMTWNLGIVHTWISPNPTSGKSDGYWDKITVTVTIDTTGLSPGDYEGFVSISANDGGGLRYFNIYCKVRLNSPPNTPTITGSTSGKAGTEYEYTIGTTDPDGDKISYFIDWGDGTYSGWTRCRTSGIKFNSSHIWDEQDSYEIKVKAMDTLGAESDWATLEVSMPKNIAVNPLFLRFLEQHSHLFPLLRQLSGL